MPPYLFPPPPPAVLAAGLCRSLFFLPGSPRPGCLAPPRAARSPFPPPPPLFYINPTLGLTVFFPFFFLVIPSIPSLQRIRGSILPTPPPLKSFFYQNLPYLFGLGVYIAIFGVSFFIFPLSQVAKKVSCSTPLSPFLTPSRPHPVPTSLRSPDLPPSFFFFRFSKADGWSPGIQIRVPAFFFFPFCAQVTASHQPSLSRIYIREQHLFFFFSRKLVSLYPSVAISANKPVFFSPSPLRNWKPPSTLTGRTFSPFFLLKRLPPPRTFFKRSPLTSLFFDEFGVPPFFSRKLAFRLCEEFRFFPWTPFIP